MLGYLVLFGLFDVIFGHVKIPIGQIGSMCPYKTESLFSAIKLATSVISCMVLIKYEASQELHGIFSKELTRFLIINGSRLI